MFLELFSARFFLIRSFLKEWFQHLTFQKSDAQYKQYLYETAKKWDNYGFYLITTIFTCVTLFGVYLNHSLQDISIKTTLWLLVVSICFVRKNSQKSYTAPFMLSVWCFFTYYAATATVVYPLDSSTNFFVLGYVHGMIELLVGLSIPNIFNRLTLQICLLAVKSFLFWDSMIAHPKYLVYFIFFGIFLIIYSIYYDILHKRSFKIIFQSREKLKKFQSIIVDDSSAGVVIMTGTLDSINYANQSFQKMFKFDSCAADKKENIRVMLKNLILDDFQTEELALFKQRSLYFLIKNTKFTAEQFKTKNSLPLYAVDKKDTAEERGYDIKLRQIIWEDKAAYAIIFNDVTDRQLIRTLKMADEQKDRVIATVSHELRTPINGILGLLELAISQVTDKLSLSYLDHAKSCSKLLLHLVNSILDLSQIRHNELKIAREKFSLDKCLDEVKSLYIYASQCKKIQFIVQKMPQVPDTILTDQHRLVQILINLLGNAMKFTFTGHVKLKVSVDKERKGKLLFEVEDTGIGIAEKDKCKLFKMFGKLDQSNKNINKQGVGLGLTIANELVKVLNDDSEDHRIHFESTPDKGSHFWFHIDGLPETSEEYERSLSMCSTIPSDQEFLLNVTKAGIEENYIGALKRGILDHRPLRAASSASLSKNSSPPTSPLLKLRKSSFLSKRALIVDDNPFNLLAATFIMQKLGFEIETASHGQECLTRLEESAQCKDHYDIILMDIQMPLMDGLEASRLITSRIETGEMYRVPIVGLTAQKIVHERDMNIYRESGMTEVLEKPLVEEKIRSIVQNSHGRANV